MAESGGDRGPGPDAPVRLPAAVGAGSGNRLGPFRHSAYTAYWIGGFVSNVGTWLQTVAGSIFVYQLTNSSLAVGIFNFASFVPILIFSVLGGQVSDRFDRRHVVTATHLASMLAAGFLAVRALAGSAGVIDLVVAAFFINTFWAIGKPSLVSLIPNIVPREDLQDAVGMNSLQFISGQIFGPVIAAFAMATSGAGLAFSINAFTYGGPVVAMLYLGRRGLGGRDATWRASQAAAAAAAQSTMSYVRSHQWVPALLVGVIASAAAVEIQRTLAPAIVHEQLGAPESAAGLLVAAQSVGSALALLLFVPIRRRGWSRNAALAGYVAQGVGVVAVALAPTLLIASIGVGFIGFGFSLSFPVLTATLQDQTPDELRGRVMALHQLAHLGNRPFTALAIGAAAAVFGAQGGVLTGLLLVPIGLFAVRFGWRSLAAARSGEMTEVTVSEPAD